ncbi:hypothetical protein ACFL0T_01760 [Candidatus Omnitrophota bacterium]
MKSIYTTIYIVVILFSYNIAQAQEVNQSVDTFSSFMIPETYGTIRDSYFSGNSREIIVHIQDLHCNYDAQVSIYNIINELIDKYGLNLVTVEGSVGRLETAPFSSYPDEKIKEQVARFFVKTGEIDGAALAHIMHKSGFTFWGVDDTKLYEDNVDAYKVSLDTSKANVKFYNNMRSIIDMFKDKVYSKELKEFDDNVKAYKDETLDFAEYVTFIDGLIKSNGLKDTEYPNFSRIREVLKKEAQIDFIEVDNQRSEYIDKLNEILDKNDLSQLLDKSLYFKVGKISALEFYSYLEQVSMQEGTPEISKDYAQLAMYIEYLKLYSNVDNIRLFKEIETLETILKDKLFTSDIQRKIDKLSYTIDVLNDLLKLKLTKDTLQFYRDNRKDFMTSSFINFITENAPKHGIKYKLDPSFRKIDAQIPSLESFYTLAEERDSILVFNTIDKMKEKRAKIAVLVSGGFHTNGMTKLLKDKGISYVVITPKVAKLQEDNPYTSVLLGEKNNFDRFYDKIKENRKTKGRK